MTIAQVVEKLTLEKQQGVTSRFPCRAVMVKNIDGYSELLSSLGSLPGVRLIQAEELFPSADVMPHYVNLTKAGYADQWVILTGVSEYLRLFGRSEAESQRFAKLWHYQGSAANTGRILIPLWGCEAQWHDPSMRLCDDPRQSEFYYDCVAPDAKDQQMTVTVLSGAFEQYVHRLNLQDGRLDCGLMEWYEGWQAPDASNTHQVLLTRRYAAVQPIEGSITIRVIADTLSFIRDNLQDTPALTSDNCPTEAQQCLFDYALEGKTLDEAILSALNLADFSGVDVMGKWNALSAGRRQLAVLWLKLHPDDSYLCHCVRQSDDTADIPEHILHDIFTLRRAHPQWVTESRRLIDAMKLTPDAAFFEALDDIPDYEERLRYLSGQSRDERVYLLHMVGQWSRNDAAQMMACDALKNVYPELYAYLGGDAYDADLRRYFALYKSYKLENTLPADEDMYFSGIRTSPYEYRYAVLSESLTDDCVVLWVDALGAEWLPLLARALTKTKEGKIRSMTVTQASLPTETCFNDQWKQMTEPHDKLDRLDKLAHKGVIDNKDYYACIEDQLSFVSQGIIKRVRELLQTHHRVIITGDHGTSRLAARFFHKREGIKPPTGATPRSHGRYCLLEGDEMPMSFQAAAKDSDGRKYLVFRNYDHYTSSGFAAGADDDNPLAGEVHGGATPEELLVPVIVFDSIKAIPLTAKWLKGTVKIMMKKAKLTLTFNRPVSNLVVKLGAYTGQCTAAPDKKQWTVVVPGVAPATYNASIQADNTYVDAGPIVIQPALGGGEGDLP